MAGREIQISYFFPDLHSLARRTEAVTTKSFQDPASLRPFLNQLQHTPAIQASEFNSFSILGEGSGAYGFEAT
jgi:hypothetical protein